MMMGLKSQKNDDKFDGFFIEKCSDDGSHLLYKLLGMPSINKTSKNSYHQSIGIKGSKPGLKNWFWANKMSHQSNLNQLI